VTGEVVFPFGPPASPEERALAFVKDQGVANSIGLGLFMPCEVKEALAILKRLEKAGKVRRSPALRAISYGGGSAWDWEAV
jgi:hypothetical protein